MRNKFILWLGISLVCFTAFVLSVRAGEKETVSLNNVNGGIEATLELPVGENQNGTFTPPEEVVAIQLSFQLSGEGSIKKEDVSFEFGSSIPQGVMKEYRYQEDTGVLNIYISGNKNIYNSKNISLGKVVVNSEEKTTVKVVKDSFKTVNSAHGMYEGEVNTGNGGQSINNGGPSGGNGDDNDVGEEMRPPEEEEKPDEGSDGQNTGGENSDSGSSGGGSSSGGEHDKKKDKNKPSAGTTGSAQKLLDAVLKDPEGEDSLVSDPVWSPENGDSQEEPEEEEPLFPEHSLWEDGAKLWTDICERKDRGHRHGCMDKDILRTFCRICSSCRRNRRQHGGTGIRKAEAPEKASCTWGRKHLCGGKSAAADGSCPEQEQTDRKAC